MPLLTLAMADVPAADAGLGSGITNVSQQISGALGLAVLSTLADNHTKGLLADHHGLTSSLIGGYHLAFIIGAATIAAGIGLAFALLRPSATSGAGAGRRPDGQRPRHPTSDLEQESSMTNISSTPRDRTSDFSDAVVASYIHEISARHRRPGLRDRVPRSRVHGRLALFPAARCIGSYRPPMTELGGIRVLVTGATSGLGAAMAAALAEAGARVMVTGRDQARADAAAAGLGSSAVPCQLDVRDERSVAACVARAREVVGRHRHARQQRGHRHADRQSHGSCRSRSRSGR